MPGNGDGVNSIRPLFVLGPLACITPTHGLYTYPYALLPPKIFAAVRADGGFYRLRRGARQQDRSPPKQMYFVSR
jgi:hypothetical protein